eukprot:9254412-Pyramimonas_sp.AAC.1
MGSSDIDIFWRRDRCAPPAQPQQASNSPTVPTHQTDPGATRGPPALHVHGASTFTSAGSRRGRKPCSTSYLTAKTDRFLVVSKQTI